ncbi:Bacterial extracellular solute-binding protein [compost metagenome]
MGKRLTTWLAVIMLMSVLLSACSPNNETIQYDSKLESKSSLKILAYTDKERFKERYVDLFNSKYPNVNVTVINYVDENFEKIMEQEKPDVLVLGTEEYKKIVQENKLVDLDTLLSNDSFNLDGVDPQIIKYMREMGKGKLYGLSPYFQSEAIYYNKDLFDKYNIPYPQDQMTWDEIIQLAKRFPVEDGVSGLYMQNLYTLVSKIAWGQYVNPISEQEKKITLNTDSYRKIFEMALDAYHSKAAIFPDIDQFEVYDPFITGESAMTMDYYYYINNKINRAQEERGNQFKLNWDLASAPVNESYRDMSPYFSINEIFTVSSESEQKQAAWEYVKFVNSDGFVKAKSRSDRFVPPVRTEYIYNPEGKRMEAFYTLNPDINRKTIDYDSFPDRFYTNISGIIDSELRAVTVGAKTLDEAMVSMQERGQQLLNSK